MRIAFFSDIHLEWRDDVIDVVRAGDLGPSIASGVLPETVEADVLLNAGDTHGEPAVREAFRAALATRYGIPVVDTQGNHDFYGQPFPADQSADLVAIGDEKIVVAPLWTRIGPQDEPIATAFEDFKKIDDVTVERWNRAHENQLAFIRQSEATIILTHHAPSTLSLDERYARSHNNCFYASELDPYLFPRAKLWVHGHIHRPRDYAFGDMRVVCHPIGYPWAETAHGFGIVDV